MKILIVEDDISLASLYNFKFSNEGFDVQSAYNGKEGLEKAESFMPDLLLVDIRMPIMNGDEMLKRLRETDWGSNMRVIILTNISKSEAPMVLRFLSVDRYIVKAHHTPSQVVQVAREVLGLPEKH
jgi:two-component system alkaline phosphatase synthesis response regulator PhoP